MLFLSSIFNLFGACQPKQNREVADVYRDLRNMALQLKPADIGMSGAPPILAVVMDTGFPEGAVSLVATADGSASLYYSTGGGIIGSGEHPDCALAAKALISEAEKYLGKMKKTEKTPIAKPKQTAFYLVAKEGVFTVSAKETDFGENRHSASPLFHKAHELISKILEKDKDRIQAQP
jgi:hypothetical protein